VFHQVLDLLDAGGWQGHQHPDRLEVLVASAAPGYDPTQTERAIRAALTVAGVARRRWTSLPWKPSRPAQPASGPS
jgi:hypothetical protein